MKECLISELVKICRGKDCFFNNFLPGFPTESDLNVTSWGASGGLLSSEEQIFFSTHAKVLLEEYFLFLGALCGW